MTNNTATQTETEDTSWLMHLFDDAEASGATVAFTIPKPPVTNTCNRCNGSGRLSYYSHNKAGVCFRCNGSGR